MDGYRHDTSLLGRRNRFRPALRHETTGRGANSGGRRAGVAIRDVMRTTAMMAADKHDGGGTIKRQIVHGIREDGMSSRKTISSMIVRLVRREAGMGE